MVSFDLSREWDPFKIREALNFHTKPHPVAVLEATAVDETFEARFSATARHYEYRILNRRAPAVIRFVPRGLPECSGQRCPTGAGVMHSAQMGLPHSEHETNVSRLGCR